MLSNLLYPQTYYFFDKNSLIHLTPIIAKTINHLFEFYLILWLCLIFQKLLKYLVVSIMERFYDIPHRR